MTEQEWLTAATEPWKMIDFARGAARQRKFRLFTCACCRQVLNPFAPVLAERAVSVAEAFADGGISAAALSQVIEAVAVASLAARDADGANGTGYLSYLLGACRLACELDNEAQAAQNATLAAARAAGDVPWHATEEVQPPEYAAELASQTDLMRDIFGNPFQSVGIELEWLTETVLALARQMYEAREFSAMSILADALQDAGCDDEDILGHCRLPREHARGCWVVDLLLGKV